jgi:hypothetical protein
MKDLKEKAYAWLRTMLGDGVKQFDGKWTVIAAGENLKGVPPMYSATDTMVFPEVPHSCGYNGGCSIFNSGEGFSILSCDFDMYLALAHFFENKDAWVHAYNAGVWFDTADHRISMMEKACRS